MKVLYSARIEDLAAKLVSELANGRKAKGPFEFLKVAVANPNLGNWLKMKVLAKVPELSAGVEMPFLDEVLAERVKASYTGGLELVSGRDYPVFILDALMNCWRKEFVPFRKYVKEEHDAGDETTPLAIVSQREARKAVQLAERLAQLIDAYEATGQLMLLEEKQHVNEVYRGEQALAETLFGRGEGKGLLADKGRISLRQMFEAVKGEPRAGNDETLVLFGQTSLTDLQIRILEWLSQTTKITWFFPGRFEKTDGELPLSDWHKATEKTRASIEAMFGDHLVVASCDKDTKDETVLSALQRGMVVATPEKTRKQDASVQVIGAPGIRREIEMVYNAILGAVWKENRDGKPVAKDKMSFSDIAVLVPDMPKYRPMIEAVFEGRGQVPYALVDTTTQDRSSFLDGFLSLMNIARYGLSRKRVFAVLENPCVQRAMGFSRDDVLEWLGLAQKYGAYDGYGEHDSDEHNTSGHFNWEWALRRMRLGLVARQLGTEKGSSDALPLEADDAESVSRLSEVVEMLWRKLDALNQVLEPVECSSEDEKLWEKSWTGRLRAVMDEFLAVEKDDSVEALVRAGIIRTLNSLKIIRGPQSYKLPVAVVEHAVAGAECAKGGYLRHGVTIGTLRSLAHVPFRQIFIVGLGEGGLPSRADQSTLDVRNEVEGEKRTDVLRPEENRARMLAAVLSARDRLVMSYPNRELGSDAKLYPSSLVNDLKAECRRHLDGGEFKEFEGYPLVESAEALVTPEGRIASAVGGEAVESCFDGLLPSYAEPAYVLAGKMVAPKRARVAMESGGEVKELAEPTPKDLAEFVKDPFTAILKRRLGIATEGYRDHCVDDATPLGVQSGRPLWKLQKEIVKGKFEEAFRNGQGEANIPCSFLGDFAKEGLLDRVRWAQNICEEDRALIAGGFVGADVKAVVCRSFSSGSEDEPVNFPPSAILEPIFYRFSRCNVGEETAVDFTVEVVNVGGKKIGSWNWKLTANEAAVYYESVRELYEECLAGVEGKDCDDAGGARPCNLLDKDGRFPSYTYEELRETIKREDLIPKDKPGWAGVARKLADGANDYDYQGGDQTFNNQPTVAKCVEAFKRAPTGKDLEMMFERMYKVPMAGKTVVKESTQAKAGNGDEQ
ncbi:MAG: exodeoxyribonuclease V subunit gamma [bacterium]|nr:exodeoxyribonuclease V subunit gamma [bacterium]